MLNPIVGAAFLVLFFPWGDRPHRFILVPLGCSTGDFAGESPIPFLGPDRRCTNTAVFGLCKESFRRFGALYRYRSGGGKHGPIPRRVRSNSCCWLVHCAADQRWFSLVWRAGAISAVVWLCVPSGTPCSANTAPGTDFFVVVPSMSRAIGEELGATWG